MSADASVKRYDLVVIGGGSGGLACAKEGLLLVLSFYLGCCGLAGLA